MAFVVDWTEGLTDGVWICPACVVDGDYDADLRGVDRTVGFFLPRRLSDDTLTSG